MFSVGPTPFVKVYHEQGGVGGGSGSSSHGNRQSSKQTLSPSADIFAGGHSQRNQKEQHRKGIRIVDPNSNQDITELIMGDKNRNQKTKKKGQHQQQKQQQKQQQHQQQQQQQNLPTEG